MLEVWVPLLLCASLAACWFHVLRLREHVTTRARQLCEQHGVQLLDESVALHSLRLRRKHGGVHALREYRFETSRGGDDRQPASITLLGMHVVSVSMPELPPPVAVSATASMPRITPSLPHHEPLPDNVIPFERRRRTLH